MKKILLSIMLLTGLNAAPSTDKLEVDENGVAVEAKIVEAKIAVSEKVEVPKVYGFQGLLEYSEKLCTDGDTTMCNKLYTGYTKGHSSIEIDKEKAEKMIIILVDAAKEGCKNKESEKCLVLHNFYKEGVVVKKDKVKAYKYRFQFEKLTEKECFNKVEKKCSILGSHYENRGDIKKAIMAYEKGCDQEDKVSCEKHMELTK